MGYGWTIGAYQKFTNGTTRNLETEDRLRTFTNEGQTFQVKLFYVVLVLEIS